MTRGIRDVLYVESLAERLYERVFCVYDAGSTMIDAQLRAEIRRLYLVEKWKAGTIARQLGIHRSTVGRALRKEGLVKGPNRPRMIDPYIPFIEQILSSYPRLPASRLYTMVTERGYLGGPDQFRHLVSLMRPKPEREAFLQLRMLPAEQAQVDWAHFGKLRVGRADRRLYAFVYVLSFSRTIFVHFTLDMQLHTFLRCHVLAFRFMKGVARTLLYDNLKSAVLERQGNAIRFNPVLLDFSNHYGFLPKAAGVARGNEKGRVERAIRYLRTSFFAARTLHGLDRLNREVKEWCLRSQQRPWQQDRQRTVQSALLQERSCLLELPGDDFPTDLRLEVKVRKTPIIRFDLNDYSVPHNHVQRTVTVLASEHRVRIFDGQTLLADHERSYSKGEQIVDPKHLEGLIDHKRRARRHRGFHELFAASPRCEELMKQLALRGENLGTQTAGLLRLLAQYGPKRLNAAVGEAIESQAPRFQSVRLIIERKSKGQPPVLPVPLRPELRQYGLRVKPHNLEDYDQLGAHNQPGDSDETNKDSI
jgi:transposase